MKIRATTIKVGYVITAGTLIMLLISCSRARKLDEVEDCGYALVADLPEVEDCEAIAMVPETFTHGRYPHLCYRGRTFVVYGTALPTKVAQEQYLTKLKAAGWEIVHDNARLGVWRLVRDQTQTITVGTSLGPIITSSDSYQNAQKIYDHEFPVTVECVFPSLDECE
jgi:hypothetical protein